MSGDAVVFAVFAALSSSRRYVYAWGDIAKVACQLLLFCIAVDTP